MIELRDTVFVDAAPEAVWDWLAALPDHYLAWHPDHLSARWVRGSTVEPGAVLEAREILHGRRHRLRMAVTDVEAGSLLRYRVFPGLGGEFEVEAADGGSRFTAVIRLGIDAPLVGVVLDRLLRRAWGSRIDAIERHQREEGANLKALLERQDPTDGHE